MLLNVHSYFSLRYGTYSVEELVESMLQYGYDTAVLTDINNSSGVLAFVKEAKRAGLNPIAGLEFRNGDELLYIGIAKNAMGFKELNETLTEALASKRVLSSKAPNWEHAYAIYPFDKVPSKKLLPHEYVGVRMQDINKMSWSSSHVKDRCVILHTVSYRDDDYKLHTQLRAIDHNLLISQLGAHQVGNATEVFIPRQQLMEAFRNEPLLIQNTNRLLANCSFDFDFKKNKNKSTFTGNRYDDKELLYKYSLDGFARRYRRNDSEALARLHKELEVIDQLHFSSYFLITDDICRYARGRNFHYVGRGSGANSIVAYCLGITEVCPITLDLYFERFLNPKRQSPPDFDIDFSWDERDEIYDYIFKRYRKGYTALMGAMSTFKGRSMIRELGKIYGLPKAEVDRMIKDPADMLNKNEVTDMIISVCHRLKDFPNQRTSHASGVLISEAPLTYYSALDYPPKGLPVVQYDMYVAEDIGFEKFDILSQRGIGHIKECKELVRKNKGIEIHTDQPQRFFKDPLIAKQLKSAHTIGCFYIESPAMRQLLTKLRCDTYLTLVAASSIIRPGVSSSGMMKAYIERHHDSSKVMYPHPVFEAQLKETYGVMVYQEDVMKIGHHYGGLDLADADVLRRMMSGKYRHAKHLKEIEDKYFNHCHKMDYPAEVSKEIWRQMESFAGYSFNKAHSASFAVESYQSLYLKTYFPKEFMVAVLNNYGGFYTRSVYVNELRKTGARIHLPCVNHSEYLTSIQGDDVYMGLDSLLNLEKKWALHLVEERIQNGVFDSLSSFIDRTKATLEQLLILIRIGAFRWMGVGKKELLWEAHLLLSGKRESVGAGLFEVEESRLELPMLVSSELEDLYDEIEIIGFPVTQSMFALAKSSYRGDVMARDLLQCEGRIVRMVGDYVTEKYVNTKRDQVMKFGTFFDNNGDFFDTVHFPDSLQAYPLRGGGLYLIEGRVVLEFGCPALEVIRCGKMPLKPDPRSE